MPVSAEKKREQRAAARAQREAAAIEARKAGQPTEIEKAADKASKRPDLIDAKNLVQSSNSGATVTVGLKLGVAHFDIQLCQMEDKFEQNLQGGRMIKEYTRVGPKVRLRGTAYPRGQVPDGFPERPLIVAGAAMNPGVSKDFWDAWVSQNEKNPLVVNGIIFAHERQEYVADRAKETAEIKSGLDPIDPKHIREDRRIPKPSRGEISAIETEEARAQKMRA